ncbi:hypothetical protein [Mesorhizobium sp. IMUNJ 23232]|uniref:head-tail connector protein n=1 Tax=Mesorhizobium sp. IMUNJ 23232 TaxID=3376064 RepID=UPI0037BB07BB
MFLTRITEPAEEPVTLAEVKAALAIIGDADDDFLSSLIRSVTGAFDGPDGRLGRCLINQTWRLNLTGFPAGPVRLPMPPTVLVYTVAYVDSAGDDHTADFKFVGAESPDGGYVSPLTSWPSGATDVAIEFLAGFGDADDVPADIKDAIIAVIGSRFAWRESQVMSQSSLSAMPEVDDTIRRWATVGFGG